MKNSLFNQHCSHSAFFVRQHLINRHGIPVLSLSAQLIMQFIRTVYALIYFFLEPSKCFQNLLCHSHRSLGKKERISSFLTLPTVRHWLSKYLSTSSIPLIMIQADLIQATYEFFRKHEEQNIVIMYIMHTYIYIYISPPPTPTLWLYRKNLLIMLSFHYNFHIFELLTMSNFSVLSLLNPTRRKILFLFGSQWHIKSTSRYFCHNSKTAQEGFTLIIPHKCCLLQDQVF